MKIAFNPSTVAALITPPNNKDITFDLRGRNIFARGVKFQGTDTNTWRDIKINNISIGSNILNLRNGSNTTLSNKDGVVTINANLSWDSITGTKPFYTKAESDTRYLQYNGFWRQDSKHDLNDASGMIFAYSNHTNSPLPNWGIITTFSYSLNSLYRFQLASNGFTNALYYRNKSADRKDNDGWTSWVKVLDTGNSNVNGNTITINGTSTTWKNTWRTVSVNGVSIGIAPLNIKAGNGVSLAESNGTVTITTTTSSPNILLHQYLSNVDTKWYPLIWGGDSHINTNDSTGRVYKSYDKLSWQTSSQTLYATRLETTYINLQNNRGISQVTSGGTSPYKGIKLPDLQSSGIGIFSKLGDGNGANEGGIIISADTSVIYNSFDTGWGLSIRDKDRGQMDISGNDTIAFGVRSDYRAYSLGGFEKSGSNNSYVLLGGGDHKLESALSVALAQQAVGAALYIGVETLQSAGYLASDYTNRYNTEEFCKALSKYLQTNYSGKSVFGTIGPNSQGFFTANIYNAGFHSNGYPYHLTIHYYPHGGDIINCGTSYGNWYYNSVSKAGHTHSWQSITNKIVAGNEFNIVSAGYSENLAINYLPINNRNSSANIGTYIMYNGNRGLASVYAKRFKVDGTGCAWMHARNYAPFYSTFNGGWEPILDIKTVSGDWAIGSYDSFGNHLVFAYESDSDYNKGANGTAQYWLSPGGEFKINTLRLTGSTNANMGVGSTNPQIIFAENSNIQQVALTYTDWDAYRASKGLKVHSYDGSDDNNVWFEVQGYNYSSGYVKNGSSDAYVLLGGGGHKPLSQFQLGSGSYLPLEGGTMKGNARIGHGSGNLYIGNSGNDGWIYTQDIASQRGTASWNIRQSGSARFGKIHIASKNDESSNVNVIESDSSFGIHLNYYCGDNISLCHGGGRVGIGTSSPSYKLGVDGSIIATSWLRTSGQCGWYSESYGGGIWMFDTSWIRTYGGKGFFCDSQIYSNSSIRMTNICLQYNDEINNDTNGKLHLNYRNTGNVTICNGGGAVTIGSTTDDIGGNKFYVKGSEFIDGVSNVRNHVFANGFRHRGHNSNDAILLAGGSYMLCKTGSTSYSKAIQIGNFVWIHISIQSSVDTVNIVPSNISTPLAVVWVMSTQNGNYSNARSGRFYILPSGVLKHYDGELGQCIYETVCYYV